MSWQWFQTTAWVVGVHPSESPEDYVIKYVLQDIHIESLTLLSFCCHKTVKCINSNATNELLKNIKGSAIIVLCHS